MTIRDGSASNVDNYADSFPSETRLPGPARISKRAAKLLAN